MNSKVRTSLGLKAVIISLSVSFCSPVYASCEDALGAPRTTLHFPRELKIDEKWMPLAITTHRQGPIVAKLGSLFAKAETVSGFWSEVALAVVEPVEAHYPFPLTERLLMNLGLAVTPSEQERVEALVPKLILHFAEVLDEEEIVLLAHLLRGRPVNTKTSAERVPLKLSDFEESVATNPLITIPFDRWLSIQKFIVSHPVYREYMASLLASDGFVAAIMRAAEYPLDEIDDETIRTTRESLGAADRLTRKKTKGIKVSAEINTYTVVTMSFVGLVQEAMRKPELRPKLEADPRAILEELEEIFIPVFKVRSDIETYIRAVDFFMWDTPVPESAESMRQVALDAARSLILDFKGELSRFKANATLEEKRAQAASRVTSIGEIKTLNPFVVAPLAKQRVKTRGTARPAEAAGPLEAVKQNDLFELTHFSRDAGPFVIEDKVYQFQFIRNAAAGPQSVRLQPEALAELRALPEREARRLLGAFVMGYTDRSARATSGVKRLYRNGQNQTALYEARPGHSNQRLILARPESGEWRILGVVEKAHFDKAVERRFQRQQL